MKGFQGPKALGSPEVFIGVFPKSKRAAFTFIFAFETAYHRQIRNAPRY
jgi:hypothetical protein